MCAAAGKVSHSVKQMRENTMKHLNAFLASQNVSTTEEGAVHCLFPTCPLVSTLWFPLLTVLLWPHKSCLPHLSKVIACS